VVAASGTTVIEIFGVGPVMAATVVGVTGDVARFPDPGSVCRLQRHRTHRGVLRGPPGVAVVAPREPHSQPRHPHGRRHPGPVGTQPGARLLRPQDRRRQDTEGSAALAQAPYQRRPLGRHGRRRPTRRSFAEVDAESRPGRATGERLCRQRGRLTPRYTGSSAKPLPNPTEGYDHQDDAATHDTENASEDPKDYLTNKEDSIGVGPWMVGADAATGCGWLLRARRG
jgi:hypothetical protein